MENIRNNTKINTILFDFDGVIADTENGRYESYCEIFACHGFDLRSRCQIKDLVGFSGEGFMRKFFPEIPVETAKKMVRKRQKHYMENLNVYCKPFPGARQTIKNLKAIGYYLALTTANSTDAAHKLLKSVEIWDYFNVVCGREICENPLTKVKDYTRVPAQINKNVEECIVIEDSPVGVSGAKRAGFYCIAFNHFNDQIITENADIIVNDYNELRKIFGLNNFSENY